MPKRLVINTILILSTSLFLGVPMSSATDPKYPLVTLEIPPVINEIGAPTAILTSLQETVIEKVRKKNLFAGVLPTIDKVDGVLVIQGTVLSWNAPEAKGASDDGALTIQLAIFQKIVTCPFNRAVVKGVVSPEMLKIGSVQSDHPLVKGALAFLSSVTGDE